MKHNTEICPCCGNQKMHDAPKCHDCYQDDLKKAIAILKEIRHSITSALLYKRINKGIAENIDTTILNVLAEIEEIK